jgi:hypothetical protein
LIDGVGYTMDRITDLSAIVQHQVEDYAQGDHCNASVYPVADHERNIYTVVVVPDRPRPFPARIVVMARVVENTVIIDEDTTDRPLVDELIRAGIPREQIVLLYAGEEFTRT